MASLAILKLSESELLDLDMDDTIQYFDSFKQEEGGESKAGSCKVLKPYEEIIAEAIRIGNKTVTPTRVQQLFDEYDEEQQKIEPSHNLLAE